MATSRRVHPANDDFEHRISGANKPYKAVAVSRRDVYEVNEGTDTGADVVSTGEVEGEAKVMGRSTEILSKRSVIMLLTFVCLLSITTFILTVGIILGKIGNQCSSCMDLTASNQQNGGSVNLFNINIWKCCRVTQITVLLTGKGSLT